MIGRALSHYKILGELGRGGMGEVYRAEDTKLKREVAIKVLPAAFSENEERLARFEREARLLASLNHPNIASIYGLEEAEGVKALVLELVQGPTLAERIAEGPIPLDEAIAIARQIADALEAAHEAGIIHRDLKPANIKIKEDGAVKVLDFGLAKALEGDAEGDASESPTMTAAATRAGVIMGTAAYMSPEQAKANRVDKRADVWAFGAVFFEMLTGKRTFAGDDVSDTLAAVLRDEPDWDALPVETPQAIRQVLRLCLTKDATHRMRDISDVRLAMDGAFDVPATTHGASRWNRAPWILAAVLGLASLGLLLRSSNPAADHHGTRRFALDLPWQTVPNWSDFEVAISPDGRHLAYAGRVENRTDLYLRPLANLEASLLAGPHEGWSVAFSPDGQRVAFFSGRELRTVSLQGGLSEPVSEIEWFAAGLSWGTDGSILIGAYDRGLSKVPASGGVPQPLTHLQDTDGLGHGDPMHLPDGRHALFTIFRAEDTRLAVLDVGAGTWQELPLRGTAPLYSPTGHLLFRQQDELLAVPFDLDDLEVRGSAVSILEGVARGPRLAGDGTLVYVAERSDGNARLVWVDRNGSPTPIPGERRDYSHIDLSSDGRHVLLNSETGDVYVTDLSRGSRSLVATGDAGFPIWDPEGNRATFHRDGGILTRVVDGSAEAETLLESSVVPTSWSPDGEYLAFSDDFDVWVLPGGGEPERLLDSGANERTARFSPDGRWLAYVSDETGEFQVYVVPFPGPGPKTPVSIEGGLSPIWSSDGSEIYFRRGSKVMMATVETGEDISFSPPVELFDGPYTLDLQGHQRYDVAPDGRFLMVENSEDFRVVIVEGFFEELNRLVPP